METKAFTVCLLLLFFMNGIIAGYRIGHSRGYAEGRFEKKREQNRDSITRGHNPNKENPQRS